MLTRCTTCNTWFRVKQNEIRAAHGDVRCGACGARFNALATLCEALPADAFENGRPTSQPAIDPVPAAVPAMEPTIAPEASIPESANKGPAVGPEENISEPVKPMRPEPTVEPDTNIGERVELEVPIEVAPYAEGTTAAAANVSDAAATRRNPLRRIPAWAWWTAGSIVLLLALLSQIVIYEHTALRANPVTRGVVETLYSAFGHPLPPRRDLDALAVTNAQVTAPLGTPGKLVVRAALSNHANFAQAWPLLRVILTNRFGSVVGQGTYEAGDYLIEAATTGGLLGAGQTTQVRLQIADPGDKAVGFVIVPCLPGEDGPVCADQKRG